jgi:RecB family exonuclease
MKLRSLSATAANTYESCPRRFQAEHLDRAPSLSGAAANLGTACHRVAQRWVEEDHYRRPFDGDVLRILWDESYWRLFRDGTRYDEGLGMIERWAKRQNWEGRTVLSTEHKRSFTLDTSIGPVPFNYIMDREDELEDGDIEVVDYKSISMPVQPSDLKNRLQSRAYALAAWLEHPNARRIWVTFDLFRYDPVGIVFTASECEDTHRYFLALAERIIADDQAEEILGNDCRWCVRKDVCATLNAHIDAAGETLAITDLRHLAEKRFGAAIARKALDSQLEELDAQLLAHLVKNDTEEEVVPGYVVRISRSRRRVVDNSRLAQLLPPEIFGRLATVGPSAVDELLKAGELDADTASLVRQTMRWTQGKGTVDVRRATD